MKFVAIILRRGEEGRGRMMEQENLTKVHCKHIWKFHNKIPHIQLINANKIFLNLKILKDIHLLIYVDL
jgi:hypothetical protein